MKVWQGRYSCSILYLRLLSAIVVVQKRYAAVPIREASVRVTESLWVQCRGQKPHTLF
jgi:hypothetical protein